MTDTTTVRRPKRSDVVGTAILGAVGLAAAIVGLGYGFFDEAGRVGPGFLPVATGGFIVVASLLEIARMYLAPAPPEGSLMGSVEEIEHQAQEVMEEHAPAEQLDTFGRTEKQRTLAIVLIFAILAVSLLLVDLIGLILAMTVATLAILLIVERQRVVTSLLVTAASVAFIYIVFVLILLVPLPRGLLGLI